MRRHDDRHAGSRSLVSERVGPFPRPDPRRAPRELDTQRQQAEPEMVYARTRVTELEQERRRLARGVVTGAIPEDLAREEQDGINKELTSAQRILATSQVVHAKIEDTLTRALALV